MPLAMQVRQLSINYLNSAILYSRYVGVLTWRANCNARVSTPKLAFNAIKLK